MFRGSSHCSTSPPSHRRISTICPHMTFHKGAFTEKLQLYTWSTLLLSQTQSPLHKRDRYKVKTQSPLHKRDRHKVKPQWPLHKRDKGPMPNSNTITSTQEGWPQTQNLITSTLEGWTQTQRKDKITILVITIDHKQHLVTTIDHKQYFSQKQDPIDRIEMIAQV